MAVPGTVTEVLAALNVATNDLAARITAIIARIGTGMTDAEVAEVVAALTATADTLNGLAVDPANPVPASKGR